MAESGQNDGRWYPEHPMVAVGAIIFRGEQILMIKRSNEPGKGKWSIPGGMLELGETLYEAAKREVLEECSIEIEIDRVFNTTDGIIRDEENRVKYHVVLVDMIAKYTGGETKAQSDAEECRWITTGEMVGMDIVQRLRPVLMSALSMTAHP
ncbi:NUDIX hydrolase [Chloroflexota bacterium]